MFGLCGASRRRALLYDHKQAQGSALRRALFSDADILNASIMLGNRETKRVITRQDAT